MKRAPSTGLIVALTVLLPVILVSAALIVLVVLTSRSVEESLGDSLVRDTASGMRDDVSFHLHDAMQVSDLYSSRVQQHTLYPDTLTAWERPMYDSLRVRPTVASICFANLKGESVYVLRRGDGMILGRSAGPGMDRTAEHDIDLNGNIDPSPRKSYSYDVAHRPWYTAAMAAQKPIWTPAYFGYSDNPDVQAPVPSLGFARTVRGAEGELEGCLVVDVTLDSISTMLQRTPLSRRGSVFLLDEHDNVLAAAGKETQALRNDRLTRLSDLRTPDLAAAAHELSGKADPVRVAQAIAEITVEGERARLIVEPVEPLPGLNWRLIAVVRESSYLSQTRLLRKRAVIVAAVFGLVAGGIGLLLAGKLSRPITTLARHVREASTGHASGEIDFHSTRELNSLAQAVNQMTRGMREEVRLRAATETAETANRAKTAFFTRVTHELRTPLNAIIGFSEMLEERTTDERARQDLSKILLASNQLLRLINDLLDLAKIESGKIDVRLRDFNVAKVVEEAVILIQPLARTGKNTLRIASPICDCRMRSDPDKLQQILMNLLGNAAKFTHAGSISIEVGCESELISFRVSDTGPGINPSEIPTLFEAFFQSKHAANQQAAGTGLGLAICRQYARLLGGDITVESEPGRGAHFTLYLPRSVGSTAESAELGSVAG